MKSTRIIAHLSIAIKAYGNACRHDPESPLPFSNLSAAQFEIGQYVQSAQSARRALALLTDGPHLDLSDKLHLRIVKCFLVLKAYREALDAVEKSSLKEKDKYRKLISQAVQVETQLPDIFKHKLNLIKLLPKFRPKMYSSTIFFLKRLWLI